MNASALRSSRMKSSEFMALINESTVLRMVFLFLSLFCYKNMNAEIVRERKNKHSSIF